MVIATNAALFTGGLAVTTLGLCGIQTGNFVPVTSRLIVVYRPYGILAIVYGSLVGLCIYVGIRLWLIHTQSSLIRIATILTSGGLVSLALIMIIAGLFFLDLQIAMLADEMNLCYLTRLPNN